MNDRTHGADAGSSDAQYVIRHGRRIEIETHVTGISPKPRRRRRDFIMTTRAQSDRLDRATCFASERIFRHLQFLSFKARGKPVRLANAALAQRSIGRNGKRAALAELECLGLIQVVRRRHHSPEVIILDLPEEN
jgi:hypothetical protein